MTDIGKFGCRWCGFSVMKWRTAAGGKKVSGWAPLYLHQQSAHPAEMEALYDELEAEGFLDADDHVLPDAFRLRDDYPWEVWQQPNL